MVAAITLIRLFVYCKPYPVFLSFCGKDSGLKSLQKMDHGCLVLASVLLNDYFQLFLLDSPMIQGYIKWRR